jgi:fatty acid-binding protein DegV
MHLGQPERAEELGAAVRRELPELREVLIVPLGAVVGAHTGPGALGLALTRW